MSRANRINRPGIHGDKQSIAFLDGNYQVSVYIGLLSSQMRPIICKLDTGEGLISTRANVLDCSWLDSFLQRDMPDICTELHTMLKVTETITVTLREG